MAKDSSFKVSNTERKEAGIPQLDVPFVEPESVDDPRWAELGADQNKINELAVKQLIVDVQTRARNRLEEGDDAAIEEAQSFTYSGGRAPRLTADKVQEGGFTEEQLEYLRSAGFQVQT